MSNIFENASSVVLNGKEVESIITTDNRIIYEKEDEDLLILIVNGSSVSSGSSTPFPSYTGDITIDWGDGNTETYTSGALNHTYATSGTYTIKIYGNITKLQFANRMSVTGLTNVTRVIVPSSVTTIGNYCFNHCSTLINIKLSDNITTLGTNAFGYCTGLTSISIPSNVTSLPMGLFNYCTGLTSVTIHDNIASINRLCFNGCSGLTSVTFEGSTPPTCATSDAWSGISSDCVFYVPSGSLSAYTSASNYPSSSTYTYVEY